MESLFFLIKIRRYKNLESKKENGKKLEGFRRKLKNINPRGQKKIQKYNIKYFNRSLSVLYNNNNAKGAFFRYSPFRG